MTTKQLAEKLQVSTDTVRRWISDSTAPRHFKIGDQYRFRQSCVEEWMRAREAKNAKRTTVACR